MSLPFSRSRLPAFLLACLCALASTCWAQAAGPAKTIGGPCRYVGYPGTATILAVTPQPPGQSDHPPTPYPPLSVTFRFTAKAAIIRQGIHEAGKVQTLTLVNGMPPGPRFVAKYGIRPGRSFPCVLNVIRQGACTPVVYVFPGIDRTDSFELRR